MDLIQSALESPMHQLSNARFPNIFEQLLTFLDYFKHIKSRAPKPAVRGGRAVFSCQRRLDLIFSQTLGDGKSPRCEGAS